MLVLGEFETIRAMSNVSEEWRWIPGWEGLYEAGTSGRIRSHRRGGDPRIRDPKARKDGYKRLRLKDYPTRCVQILMHRAVALAFFGAPPPGHQVNHKNGDKSDNRPSNLEYVEQSDNMAHAVRVLGRKYNMTMTDAQVAEVRAIYDASRDEAGRPKHGLITGLARQYGVSVGTMFGYLTRRTRIRAWGR